MRHDWSQADILKLMVLYNEEKTAMEISELMKMPNNSIKYKIQALRKMGTLTVLYKTCYICRLKYPQLKDLTSVIFCYEKSKKDLKGKADFYNQLGHNFYSKLPSYSIIYHLNTYILLIYLYLNKNKPFSYCMP